MKKVFTSLLVFLAALNIGAEGFDYSFNWGKSIEGTVSQSANVIGIKQASDGNYFTAMVWGGTSADGKTVSWGGENLHDASGADIEGADYNKGSSYNPNLLFSKTDKKTGLPIWSVYSNFGYVENTYCDFEPTTDGGAVVMARFRQSEEADYRLANIVGADGTVTHLQHTDADKLAYRTVLMKIDADGKVAWTRTINALDEAKGGGSAVQPFYTTSVAVNTDGRIYVSGRMCTTVYFQGRNGRIVAKDAVYTDGWSGDSQENRGNAFIAVFSADGYIDDVIMHEGSGYAYTQTDCMVIDGNTLYAFGVAMKSDAGSLIRPTLSIINLETNSLVAYKEYAVASNAGGKQNFKIYGLNLIDGCLYLTGNLTGNMTDNNVTLTATGTSATLDGYIARFDLNGNLLSAKNYGNLNTGIMGVTEVSGSLIATAYQMTGGGTMALAYDKALSTEISRTVIISSGTTATVAEPLFDGENIVIMSRGAKAASAFYGTSDVKPALKNGFGVLLGSWKINGNISTGVNVAVKDAAVKDVIYGIGGIKMHGETSQQTKGLYIYNGRKIVID